MIYFDYLCEFCELGRRAWEELLPLHPGIEPEWRPCEAHPRTEEPGYGRHSDLAIQGMFFVREQGGDVRLYNSLLFDDIYRRGENPEDMSLLARCARQAGTDPAAFRKAVASGRYEDALREANREAWGTLGLRAVPTFILEDGRRLDAVLGVGVSRTRLAAFLEEAGH